MQIGKAVKKALPRAAGSARGSKYDPLKEHIVNLPEGSSLPIGPDEGQDFKNFMTNVRQWWMNQRKRDDSLPAVKFYQGKDDATLVIYNPPAEPSA
jgi:hypothetical protein